MVSLCSNYPVLPSLNFRILAEMRLRSCFLERMVNPILKYCFFSPNPYCCFLLNFSLSVFFSVLAFIAPARIRIVREQKHRTEVQWNNLHFHLFLAKGNANYSPESQLYYFSLTQFETSLFCLGSNE